ncbi:MAG: outer membrane protein assembly factor BamE [Alphaproteobacteria bacterium]|nr:outer membrane protein assembly factor BamE [Alphaproteobacteria bacterium]
MLRQSQSGNSLHPTRRAFAALLTGAMAASLVACSPVIDHRGYLPRSNDIQKLQVGMSKTEVESLLGSPSTTATVNTSGDSYYYVSSRVEQKPIIGADVQDRQVIAVRFDYQDRVQNFAHYGLEDGQIVNFISRETPTRGRERSLLKEFFGNLGKFEPGAAGGTNKGPGR